MNKYIYILLASFTISAMMACSGRHEEKKDETRIVIDDIRDDNGMHKMQISNAEQVISFKGKNYRSTIVRTPNDSLPKVKSEGGDMFLDNEITLRLTRDNTNVFHKKFSKKSFSSLVPSDFLKNSILEGMVFDKTTPQGIVYAVSISYPQTDLYFPISLTITIDGKMSMVKDELIEEIWEDQPN